MSFDNVKNAGTAPAPQSAVAKGTTDTKNAQFKNMGASIRATMTEDQKAIEGSKSDKVAFVCALGDPTHGQPRREGGKDIPSFVVVGYKFKALEDMSIPNAPIVQDYKNPLDVEFGADVKVKAGQIFSLNVVETCLLISRTEFGGHFTGEGTHVTLSVRHSKTRVEPRPILNSADASVKVNMDLVAEMVGATADNAGTPKVKDEYAEKFGVLFQKRERLSKKGLGREKTSGEASADIAAAFRKYYADKAAQAK